MNLFANKVKKISKTVVTALDILKHKSNEKSDMPDSISQAVLKAMHDSGATIRL